MKEGSTYQYSAEDLQRYVDGKMDQAEMHAIEKAALDDPFLSDAIEGIRDMRPNLKEDIKEMQHKLEEKKQEERKRKWLPIVLAIALLLSLSFGGWLIFRNDGNSSQIARVEEAQPATSPDPAPVQDSLAQDNLSKAADVQAESSKELEAAKTDKTAVVESKPAKDAATKVANSASAPALIPPKTSASEPAAPPLAGVDASSRKAEETAKKNLTAPSKAEAELSKQADAQAAAPAARSKGAYQFEMLEMAKNVEPVTGWSAFAKYVQANMQRPAGGLHGTVGTNFIVAPDGTISDIRVVKSLHPDYDKEAIRLLQNGPKWKASNGGDKAVKAVYNVVF
ncbi:MAG TPA: energy transducer TonB [Chitinophagaceae bacterium]|nr:energy transducer TonB [Chitinophagaceae bacterium]